jgi:uncharacterized repeat protein (TIGR01451 family)
VNLKRKFAAVLSLLTFASSAGLATSASAASSWSLSASRITAASLLSGAKHTVRLNFQCSSVDDPACLGGVITIPLTSLPSGYTASAVPHPLIASQSISGANLILTLSPSIPVGTSASLDIEIAAPNHTTPNGFVFSALPTLSGTNTSPVTAATPATLTWTATGAPKINKYEPGGVANGTKLPLNSPIQYGIEVCDTGSGANGHLAFQPGSTVVDTLPVGAVFVSADNGGVYDPTANTVTWTLASAAPTGVCGSIGMTVTVSYPGQTPVTTNVDDNPLNGFDQVNDSVTNTAVVSGTLIGQSTPLTASASVTHAFAAAVTTGVAGKTINSTFMQNRYVNGYQSFYWGDIYGPTSGDGYYEVSSTNTGTVAQTFTLTDELPCLDNPGTPVAGYAATYTSAPLGTICAHPAVNVKRLVLGNMTGAVGTGYTVRLTMNNGRVVNAPIASVMDVYLLVLPGEFISEIFFAETPLMTVKPGNFVKASVYFSPVGANVYSPTLATLPTKALFTNRGNVTLFYQGTQTGAYSATAVGQILPPETYLTISTQFISEQNAQIAQGNEAKVITAGNYSLTAKAGLVISDLLPSALFLAPDKITFTTSSGATVPGWTVEVLPNYLGTGRFLVRAKADSGVMTPPGAVYALRVWTRNMKLNETPGGLTSNSARISSTVDVVDRCNVNYTTNVWPVYGLSSNNQASMVSNIVDPLDEDTDGNLTDTSCISTSTVTRSTPSAVMQSLKEVQGDIDVTEGRSWQAFAGVGSVTASGSGTYRLTLRNSGTLNINSFVAYDILPFVGDTGVSESQLARARGSVWRPTLSAVPSVPSIVLVSYSLSSDPCRPEVSVSNTTAPSQCVNDWSTVPPSDLSTVRALKFQLVVDNGILSGAPDLTPLPFVGGTLLQMTFPVAAPAGLVPGQTAWNSLAMGGVRADTLAMMPATEPAKVGLAVPQSDVSLTKAQYDSSGSGATGVTTGETVTYIVTVKHDATVTTNADGSVTVTGPPTPARNVHVSDLLPAGLTVAPGSVSTIVTTTGLSTAGTWDSSTGDWNVGTLNPGETAQLRYNAVVNLPLGGTIRNRAEVSTNSVIDFDSAPGNCGTYPTAIAEDDCAQTSLLVGPPAVQLEKSVQTSTANPTFIAADGADGDVNAYDLDEAQGAAFTKGLYGSGKPVNFRFTVMNTGSTPLNNIVITDPMLAPFCAAMTPLPATVVQPGATLTISCTLPIGVGPGTTVNTASVTASYKGTVVSDSDTAAVFVPTPHAVLDKKTNGLDAATAATAAPISAIGEAVTWTYQFSNDGQEAWSAGSVVLTDDQEPTVSLKNPNCVRTDALALTVAWPIGVGATCTFTGVAKPGLYTNTAKLRVIGATSLAPVTTTDISYYQAPAAASAIAIVKRVNGADANTTLDEKWAKTGSTLTWTFEISNTGNTPLSGVTLVDPTLVPAKLDATHCVYSAGATVVAATGIGTFPIGSSAVCTFTSAAVAGRHLNTASTSGSYAGVAVSASDPANYLATTPHVSLIKTLNGSVKDTLATAAIVSIGSDIAYTLTYTNDGDEVLNVGSITDDREPSVNWSTSSTCTRADGQDLASTPFAPGNIVLCTYHQIALPGGYHTNNADISAEGVTSHVTVKAFALAIYNTPDAAPSISLLKEVNGQDANAQAAGPRVKTGDPVAYRFTIRNTGNTPLTGVTLTDPTLAAAVLSSGCVYAGGASGSTFPIGSSAVCAVPLSGGAVAGVNVNTASVVGSFGSAEVTASDPAVYVGSASSVSLVKRVNANDADTAGAAANVSIGDAVTWEYTITNSGDEPLVNLVLADDKESAVNLDAAHCAALSVTSSLSQLNPGDTLVCAFTGTALPGLYTNTGRITASGFWSGNAVTANDPANYLAPTAAPSIALVKKVNGQDANSNATAPQVAAGSTVTWTFEVSNTGNTPLSNVVLSDPDLPAATLGKSCTYTGGGSGSTFPIGSSAVCTVTGVAGTYGYHLNTATVNGVYAGTVVSDTNPATYLSASPSVTLIKKVNAVDADTPGAAANVSIGDAVTWEYTITNSGDEPLVNLVLADDKESAVNLDAAHCAALSVTSSLSQLNPGDTLVCAFTGTALPGLYTNTGRITASGFWSGNAVTANDPANYLAPTAAPSIALVKKVNGQDANSNATAPQVAAGSTVTWTFEVSNTGNTPLSNVVLSDPDLPAATLGKSCTYTGGASGSTFPIGSSAVCTVTGVAGTYGYHLNTATVNGAYVGTVVSDTNPATYLSASPSVTLTKTVNGQDADTAGAAVSTSIGDRIVWVVVATNSGDEPLVSVAITDDKNASISLTDSRCVRSDGLAKSASLAPGAFVTCTYETVALPGLNTNTASVTAKGESSAQSVEAANPANYVAPSASPSVAIEKKVNNATADIEADAVLVAPASVVSWTYEIVNTGNTPLVNVTLSDDKEAAVVVDAAHCARNDGATDIHAQLPSGKVITCVWNGAAGFGRYANTGTVRADYAGTPVIAANDAHYKGAVALGNKVWDDLNHDGLQGVNEPGIDSLTVSLFTTDANGQLVPALDADGLPVPPTVTGGNGRYVFDNLTEGVYSVQFGTPATGRRWTSQHASQDATTDSDVNAAGLAVYAINASTLSSSRLSTMMDGTSIASTIFDTVDAGQIVELYAVSDRAWVDRNRNGLQDAGEANVPNVPVSLLNEDGTPSVDFLGRAVLPVLTDANGNYIFDSLLPGSYRVKFGEVANFVRTSTAGDPVFGSDASTDGTTKVIVLGPENTAKRAPVASDGVRNALWVDSTWDAGYIGYIDLNIEKKLVSAGPFHKDSILTFTLDVSNTGSGDALAGLRVVDVMPAGLQLVSMTGGEGWACDIGSVSCVYGLPLLSGAHAAHIIVVAKVTGGGGSLKNVAYVAPSESDVPEMNALVIPVQSTDTLSSATDNDAQAELTLVEEKPPTTA